MKPFKHFVIIKFNYPEGCDKIETKKQVLKWISLDSLRKQTNKDFVLVLITDMELSSEGFGEYIFSLNWKDKIKKMCDGYEWIITTRMDADDFVTPDFIQTIQDNFEKKDKLVISPNCSIYDVRSDKLISSRFFGNTTLNNLSMIEKVDNLETVYVRTHGEMGKLYPTKWIDKILWTWVIWGGCIQSNKRKSDYFDSGQMELNKGNCQYYINLIKKFDDKITNIEKTNKDTNKND